MQEIPFTNWHLIWKLLTTHGTNNDESKCMEQKVGINAIIVNFLCL